MLGGASQLVYFQVFEDGVLGEIFRGRVVLAALESLNQQIDVELDEETLRAIEEGEARLDRGEGRPWEEVREELRAKYLRK